LSYKLCSKSIFGDVKFSRFASYLLSRPTCFPRPLGSGNQNRRLPFVAISHVSRFTPIYAESLIQICQVWADGLGNQEANALNSCELIRLRTPTQTLMIRDDREQKHISNGASKNHTLIWIDTLCCPVSPSIAKNIALQKIRDVYQSAQRVLILEASLEAYKAEEMKIVEKLGRIYASGWLRRLWTLQEGALARSLYFQFAYCALYLETLRKEIEQKAQVDL
jgi:hypothetical protein